MIYKYKAISQNGEVIEGFFEGNEESDVLAMLKGNNYLPVSVEKDISSENKIDIFSKKIKKKDLAVFCRQFYTMLDAGIGIVKCIDILEKQSENKNLKKALGTLHENVQKGFTLSEGMKKHSTVFPSLLINMVEAGEVSGNLDIIMERMAVHFEKENKLENKIKSALIYPVVLAVVSIAVVIFLLVAVMPTFIGMFESSGQALPKPTQILLNISNWLTEYWYIFIPIVLALIFGFVLFKQTPTGTNFVDTLKIKIPVIKDTNVKIITARFARTLSTLMSSGIPLLQSIEIVSRVVGNKIVHDRLEIASEDVRKGISLSRAVNEVGIFPPMVDSMIKIGEESGSLDDILYKTADFYDEEVEVALQRMTSLMEPVMLVIMALIIGFIVIAMAMPMFDMVNTIQ
ncbi:type IV pilus assembly protein PilC [Tissierella praeacuta DSM 18095]|uniref:Type IV pilus assembly protein PilC n=1 Tax=Tissierella praeacuta DSM 18095 TaxID=1123404 RepID=A0A1M4SBS1_9FIRM|nr:type II secretion system F family protein [Tissierella praeacuta]SHE29622.1 type IV pilus assembly protein PilC [Tissierella praeacuta DSM 18095]SUP01246.1 Cholera toxin secretion protein epsF [Tissierella praeacuta]